MPTAVNEKYLCTFMLINTHGLGSLEKRWYPKDKNVKPAWHSENDVLTHIKLTIKVRKY